MPLVWAVLWRDKSRTILTLLSIVVAFLLYGMLSMANFAIEHPESPAGADNLITVNRYSNTLPLPISVVDQIKKIPGVKVASWFVWFGGYYQEPKNSINAFPVDIDSYLDLHRGEYQIGPGQVEAFKVSRSGALVSADLAKTFGWKIGSKVTLRSTVWIRQDQGSPDWTFDIVGTFVPKDPVMRRHMTKHFLFQYDYLDESRSFMKGQISWVQLSVKDPQQAAIISKEVDKLFANSPFETKTSTAAGYATEMFKQQGDFILILRVIIGAVFFALLFLTGNTMMQSVLERVRELGVLKSLGFTNTIIMSLVVAESLMLSLFAAGIGLGLSCIALPLLQGFLPEIRVSTTTLLSGFGYASLLALGVGLPPAIYAGRLKIIDALRSIR